MANNAGLKPGVYEVPVDRVQASGHVNDDGTISILVFNGEVGFDLTLSVEDARRISDGIKSAIKATGS